MAYSNINRDNTQPERVFDLKTLGFIVGLLIVVFSSIFNILGKYNTLKEARNRNKKLETGINQTVKENNIMLQQIKEATSSGYMERKAREYLGLGTTNDVWLVLPTTGEDLKLNQEVNIVETKPNIVQWWELFTK